MHKLPICVRTSVCLYLELQFSDIGKNNYVLTFAVDAFIPSSACARVMIDVIDTRAMQTRVAGAFVDLIYNKISLGNDNATFLLDDISIPSYITYTDNYELCLTIVQQTYKKKQESYFHSGRSRNQVYTNTCSY